MHAFPVSLALLPLPNVAITLHTHPCTVSVLHTVDPIALVDLPVAPEVSTVPFRSAVNELPGVDVPVWEKLVA